MIEFKNDLYRTEWLELVFAGRNKAYGAYELRMHNSATTLKALIAGSVFIIFAICAPLIYSRVFDHPVPDNNNSDAELKLVQFSAPPKFKTPKVPAVPNRVERSIPARKFIPLVPVPVAQATDDVPSIEDLKNYATGQETVAANAEKGLLNPEENLMESDGQKTIDMSVEDPPVNLTLLESYPEFPGGQSAFNKFIGRNLRYPATARDNRISGRVFVSFVIEKDGTLSHIRIIRAIGGGCEEEAIRVLKKSPSWSSGVQNGRKVRVEYTMPIYFQLDE